MIDARQPISRPFGFVVDVESCERGTSALLIVSDKIEPCLWQFNGPTYRDLGRIALQRIAQPDIYPLTVVEKIQFTIMTRNLGDFKVHRVERQVTGIGPQVGVTSK